jgi:hypothetical protein
MLAESHVCIENRLPKLCAVLYSGSDLAKLHDNLPETVCELFRFRDSQRGMSGKNVELRESSKQMR